LSDIEANFDTPIERSSRRLGAEPQRNPTRSGGWPKSQEN
jgi:hypothetical protein